LSLLCLLCGHSWYLVNSRTWGWCTLARVLTAVVLATRGHRTISTRWLPVRIGQELSATLHGGCRPPDRTGSARRRDCLLRGWTKVLQGSGGNGMRTLWLNGRGHRGRRLDSGQQVGRRSAFRRRRHWQYGTSSPHISARRRTWLGQAQGRTGPSQASELLDACTSSDKTAFRSSWLIGVDATVYPWHGPGVSQLASSTRTGV
jgi:hypothetical protein